jgi:hypothetical protein
VFVRVRSDNGFAFNLALSDGTILERYATKYDWTLAHVLAKIDAPSDEAHSLPHGQNEWSVRMHDNVSKPSFRITASPSSAITLTPKGWSEPVLRTTVAELASGPVVTTARMNDVPTTVRLELTLDACEPNMDYPLPAEGQYIRHVAADALHDGTRYFHAWALTASDRIAYSRPIALIRTPAPAAEATVVAPDDPVAAPFIQTRGTFDDFMDESSSVSRNPFTMSDVVHGTIAARLVPYYLYDCEERAGTQLNDSGTAHQCGRAWLVGPHEWIQDGWRGYGLRLKGGRIQLRSKSFPHGPYTFSARVRVAGEAGAAQSLAGDGDYWNEITTEGVRIDLLADGRVRAARKIGASEGLAVSDAALKPGWNHLVVTYDLESLCIYLNGALSARTAVPQPAYQRTHSIPAVGFSKVADAKKDAMVFTGDLDQIEIIGTALEAAAVEQLTQRGQWMSRGGGAPAAAAAR